MGSLKLYSQFSLIYGRDFALHRNVSKLITPVTYKHTHRSRCTCEIKTDGLMSMHTQHIYHNVGRFGREKNLVNHQRLANLNTL